MNDDNTILDVDSSFEYFAKGDPFIDTFIVARVDAGAYVVIAIIKQADNQGLWQSSVIAYPETAPRYWLLVDLQLRERAEAERMAKVRAQWVIESGVSPRDGYGWNTFWYVDENEIGGEA